MTGPSVRLGVGLAVCMLVGIVVVPSVGAEARGQTPSSDAVFSTASPHRVDGRMFAAADGTVSTAVDGPSPEGRSVRISFEGLSGADGPADPHGAVGREHYVQLAGDEIGVWLRDGTPVATGRTSDLFVDSCPGTLYQQRISYDYLADRWVVAAAVSSPDALYGRTEALCLAVSSGADPSGAWTSWRVSYEGTLAHEDLHVATWAGSYVITANVGETAQIVAVDRRAALRGGSVASASIDRGFENGPDRGLIPAQASGVPAGAGLLGRLRGDEVLLWELNVDWASFDYTFGTGAGYPSAVARLELADHDVCEGLPVGCVQQPGAAPMLQAEGGILHALAWRDLGDRRVLAGSHTVDVGGRATAAWFVLESDLPGSWRVAQEGRSPEDADHRWSGGVAVDGAGDFVVPYAASGPDTYPSLRAHIGTGELDLASGTGAQLRPMGDWEPGPTATVDPVDDCMIWVTGAYSPSTSANEWATRVAGLRDTSCTRTFGSLEGTVSDAASGAPVPGATVVVRGPVTRTTTAEADGSFTFPLTEVGTYEASATTCFQSGEPVITTVESGETSSVVLAVEAMDLVAITGSVKDPRTGWPVHATVSAVDGCVDDVTHSDPGTGDFTLQVMPADSVEVSIDAVVEGYDPVTRVVDPRNPNLGNVPLQFSLRCVAPGHGFLPVHERFEPRGESPAGWTVVDDAGDGRGWRFDDSSEWYGEEMSGGFAVAGNYASGRIDTSLVVPPVDLSEIDAPRVVFSTDFVGFQDFLGDSNTGAYVDLSTDGGDTWQTIWRRTTPYRGLVVLDVPQVAGQSDVRARFRYVVESDSYGHWALDDVGLGRCVQVTDGLVVGSVRGTDGSEVSGVSISDDLGHSTRSFPAPASGGFYVLPTDAGVRTLSAEGPTDAVLVEAGKVATLDLETDHHGSISAGFDDVDTYESSGSGLLGLGEGASDASGDPVDGAFDVRAEARADAGIPVGYVPFALSVHGAYAVSEVDLSARRNVSEGTYRITFDVEIDESKATASVDGGLPLTTSAFAYAEVYAYARACSELRCDSNGTWRMVECSDCLDRVDSLRIVLEVTTEEAGALEVGLAPRTYASLSGDGEAVAAQSGIASYSFERIG